MDLQTSHDAPPAQDPQTMRHLPPPALAAAPDWACSRACASCPVRRFCLPSWSLPEEGSALDAMVISRRRVRRGQTLFHQGDRFTYLYAVRYGTLKSSAHLRDGREQVMAFHLPGEIFGFDGLADGSHPTTARALEDAEVCVLPYAELNEAAGASRHVRQHMASAISAQLIEERKVVALIANTLSQERVAAFLCALAGRMRDRGYSSREFQLRMTREEIGSYLGITLETVSRCLAALAREGLLRVRRRHIEVLDSDGLQARTTQF
jgi:CRP/FNR family transcriptional regulator